MKSKFAFAAAAAVIASAGAASAADFAAGNYLFTSTITAVSDAAGGAICAGFKQTVGTVGVSFATYTPATSSTTGSLLQLADAPSSIYSIAESIPAGQPLVKYQGTATSVRSVTFPLGIAQDNGVIASVTLKYTTVGAVTEVLSVGTATCTITQKVVAKKIS